MNIRRSQRYDLVRPIGAGGMGEVFLAVASGAHGFQKQVAVKRVRPELSADDGVVRRFIAEAKLAVSLSHANVVQVLDLGAVGSELFIVMEYVEGTDLGRLLSGAQQRAESVPLELGVHLAREALGGLAYAHARRVVHCDISPSNLLVSLAGEVKLTDFGVARVMSQARAGSAMGPVAGKPGYIAPETLRGDAVGPPADVYAVGVLLCEMLTGARPASAEDPLLGRDDAPPALRALVARALRQSPGERPRDAGEMLAELAAIAHHLERPATAAEIGAWARRLAPSGIALQDDALDLALQNLIGGSRARTATAQPPPGMAFVAHARQDGTTVWEPAPPRRVRFRPALAVMAGALVLTTATGLLLVRSGSRPAPIPSAPQVSITASALSTETVPPVPPDAPPPATQTSPPPQHPRSASRAASPGFLNVYADPWAYVRVDGKPVGTTPLLRLPVTAGSHRVQLESPNAQSAQRQVRIASGETQLISVDLARRGTP